MEEESRSVPRNVVVMAIGNNITTSANSIWIIFMPSFYEDVASRTNYLLANIKSATVSA